MKFPFFAKGRRKNLHLPNFTSFLCVYSGRVESVLAQDPLLHPSPWAAISIFVSSFLFFLPVLLLCSSRPPMKEAAADTSFHLFLLLLSSQIRSIFRFLLCRYLTSSQAVILPKALQPQTLPASRRVSRSCRTFSPTP